jgi:hypothetical protein
MRGTAPKRPADFRRAQMPEFRSRPPGGCAAQEETASGKRVRQATVRGLCFSDSHTAKPAPRAMSSCMSALVLPRRHTSSPPVMPRASRTWHASKIGLRRPCIRHPIALALLGQADGLELNPCRRAHIFGFPMVFGKSARAGAFLWCRESSRVRPTPGSVAARSFGGTSRCRVNFVVSAVARRLTDQLG